MKIRHFPVVSLLAAVAVQPAAPPHRRSRASFALRSSSSCPKGLQRCRRRGKRVGMWLVAGAGAAAVVVVGAAIAWTVFSGNGTDLNTATRPSNGHWMSYRETGVPDRRHSTSKKMMVLFPGPHVHTDKKLRARRPEAHRARAYHSAVRPRASFGAPTSSSPDPSGAAGT